MHTKKTSIALLTVLALLMAAGTLRAQYAYPSFEPGNITIRVPIYMPPIQVDSPYLRGDSLHYPFTGIVFREGQGRLPGKKENFNDENAARQTPWHTLAAAVYYYQQKDFNSVLELYTKESRAVIDKMLTPSKKDSFIAMMSAIQDAEVLVGFEHEGGFVALVDMKGVATNPVFFVKKKKQYYLSTIHDKGKAVWNITTLYTYKPGPFVTPQLISAPDTVRSTDTAVILSFRLQKPGDYLALAPGAAGQPMLHMCKDNSPLDQNPIPGMVSLKMSPIDFRSIGPVEILAVESNYPVVKTFDAMRPKAVKLTVFLKQ